MSLCNILINYFLFTLLVAPFIFCFEKNENQTEFENQETRSNNEVILQRQKAVIVGVGGCTLGGCSLVYYCTRRRKVEKGLTGETEAGEQNQQQEYRNTHHFTIFTHTGSPSTNYNSSPTAPSPTVNVSHIQTSDRNSQRQGKLPSFWAIGYPKPIQSYPDRQESETPSVSTSTQKATPTIFSNWQSNRRNYSQNVYRPPHPSVYSIPRFPRAHIRSFPNANTWRTNKAGLENDERPPPSWTSIFSKSGANNKPSIRNNLKSVLTVEELPPSYYDVILTTSRAKHSTYNFVGY